MLNRIVRKHKFISSITITFLLSFTLIVFTGCAAIFLIARERGEVRSWHLIEAPSGKIKHLFVDQENYSSILLEMEDGEKYAWQYDRWVLIDVNDDYHKMMGYCLVQDGGQLEINQPQADPIEITSIGCYGMETYTYYRIIRTNTDQLWKWEYSTDSIRERAVPIFIVVGGIILNLIISIAIFIVVLIWVYTAK